jgi:competence protein ComEA
VYTLPPGSRIGDALVRAGGLKGDADASMVNQAGYLRDAAQVHVPELGAGTEIIPVMEPKPGLSDGVGRAPATAIVNLNIATQAELETLPGIGSTKAMAIIAARPFSSVDDLLRVPGIGDKTVAQLRDLVTAQ